MPNRRKRTNAKLRLSVEDDILKDRNDGRCDSEVLRNAWPSKKCILREGRCSRRTLLRLAERWYSLNALQDTRRNPCERQLVCRKLELKQAD